MKTGAMGLGAVASLCLALTAVVSADGPALLTLRQAIAEALANNDRIVNQRDAIEQSSLGVRLARNEFQPKVIPNMLGSFGQTDVNSQNYRIDVTQKLTTGTEMRMGVGTSTSQIPGAPGTTGDDIHFYNADTTLTVSQPLLRGFGANATRRSLTIAEVRRVDADRQVRLTEQQVTIDVASAYYRVIAQQAFVDVASRSLDRARQLRDASEAKLSAGLVSQLDVLRAQQLATQAESQLVDAQSAVEDARDQLTSLMQRETSGPFEVASEIPKPDESPLDPNEAVAVAIAGRLDLQSLVANGEDADRQIAFARNQLLPQVDVNFAYTRRETAQSFARSFGFDRFKFATFFTVSTPVDRTPQLIAYRSAILDRDRRQREIAAMRRQITDTVKHALRDRDRLLRAWHAAEASVEIARKEVEVARLRYERGLSNNLDVVSAEGDLLAAEGRRIATLAESAVARLSLLAALGTLDPRKDP